MGFVFFNDIWGVLREPYLQGAPARPAVARTGCGSRSCFSSVFDPILWHFKVALITGVVLGSPVWLYEIWAFVTPGLHAKERRYSIAFVGSAVPLFLAGATLAYFVMSKGLHLLLHFAPKGTISLISIDHYLSYALAMLLMFGASFDVPLLVVMLNFVGVLSYARLKKSRRLSIFLVLRLRRGRDALGRSVHDAGPGCPVAHTARGWPPRSPVSTTPARPSAKIANWPTCPTTWPRHSTYRAR